MIHATLMSIYLILIVIIVVTAPLIIKRIRRAFNSLINLASVLSSNIVDVKECLLIIII